MRKDARIRGHISKPKGVRGQTSLENTHTDVNVEEIKHKFITCQQNVGLNQTIRVCNNSFENVAKSIQFKTKLRQKIQPCDKKCKFHS